MDIAIYCTCAYRGANTPDHLAACGMVLTATDEDNIKKREFAYGLNKSSPQLSELQCVRLALLALSGRCKNAAVTVYTDCSYAYKVLTKQIETKTHAKVFEAIDYYLKVMPQVKFVMMEDHQLINRSKELAKSVVGTQKFFDSKTIDC